MKREPPPTQPNGWEKSSQVTKVKCTPTEKLFWQAAFGRYKLAGVARALLNREAHRVTGVPLPAPCEPEGASARPGRGEAVPGPENAPTAR